MSTVETLSVSFQNEAYSSIPTKSAYYVYPMSRTELIKARFRNIIRRNFKLTRRGGMTFLSVGKLRVSWCVTSKPIVPVGG